MANRILLVLALAALGAAPISDAAPHPREIRVGIVLGQDSPPYRDVARGFTTTLAAGGRAVSVDTHVLGDSMAALREIERLRSGASDVVLVLGSNAARIAARSRGTAPMILSMVLKQAEIPTTGATGVFLEFPPSVEFEWLHRVVPDAGRIGVLYNAAENGRTVETAEAVAAAAGMRLHAREVLAPADIPRQLSSLENDANVLWGLPDSLVLTPGTARTVLLFSLRNRIPFFGISEAWVRAGALYALDRDYADVGRQCGDIALRIIAGERVASIMPQPPRKVELIVSRRAAEMLGVMIPPDLLKRARTVIE
jgi:putative tryptophan/tyrosine transport system substrate-binding protein